MYEPGPRAGNNLIVFYTLFYISLLLGMNMVRLAIIKVGGEQSPRFALKRATPMPVERRISVPLTRKPGFLYNSLQPRDVRPRAQTV